MCPQYSKQLIQKKKKKERKQKKTKTTKPYTKKASRISLKHNSKGQGPDPGRGTWVHNQPTTKVNKHRQGS